MTFLLRCDILVCNQIHTVPSGGDNACVGHRIQRNELVEINRLVEEMNRHEFNGAWIMLD